MSNNNKTIGRRKFIENAAFAGAIGAMSIGALSACKSKKTAEELGLPPLKNRAPKGKKLRAGLIGCGHRGTGTLLNFLSAGPGLEVGALADIFPDKIETVRERLRKYKMEVPDEMCFSGLEGYKKVMESDVDVVLLATPPYFRPDHFKEAVQAKKHVFMEKPVAVDPVGVRKVIMLNRFFKKI